MKKIFIPSIFIFLMMMMMTSSCRKCKQDPCRDLTTTTADVYVYACLLATYEDDFRKNLPETDSIYSYAMLLEPKQDCDSVK